MGWGRGSSEFLVNGSRASIRGVEKVPEMDSGGDYATP